MLVTKEELVKKVMHYIYAQKGFVPVKVSNRHLHLTEEAVTKLFGADYSLTPLTYLMGGQFAAEETVKLVGPDGVLEKVRVLGPPRDQTQIEILLSDTYQLGIEVPIKMSGSLENTPGIVVVGPEGVLDLDTGLICAKNHIHVPSYLGKVLEVKDGEKVDVKSSSPRPLVFENVAVRIKDEYNFEMHIDIDEANAANLSNGELVKII